MKSGVAILPEEIQDFIYDEMAIYAKPSFNRFCDHNQAQGSSVNLSKRGISKHSTKLCEEEEEMICPRYIMKIIGKYTNQSIIKLFYSVDALMASIMSNRGHGDLIIQPFIRQKHISKPSKIRYYMKSNSGVYKANSIVNRHELDKKTQFYQNIVKQLLMSNKNQIRNAYQK